MCCQAMCRVCSFYRKAAAALNIMLLCTLQVYTESTDGSYLDIKESALVWHYKDADPDFGRWQAKVCTGPTCM